MHYHAIRQMRKREIVQFLFFLMLTLKETMSLSIESSGIRQKSAIDTMKQFGKRTGLVVQQDIDENVNSRCLWTDSFALCNHIGFSRYCSKSGDEHGKKHYEALCHKLIDNVHNTLGRFRMDDLKESRRMKWISGLSEEEGKLHPTIGGLRIGKDRVERDESEAYNERSEWGRDGQ